LIDDNFWLTDKKIIPFTCDSTFVELNRMRLRLIMDSIKNDGYWHLFKFITKKIFTQPKLTFINAKNIILGKLSLK
jgi:hypothetical protein